MMFRRKIYDRLKQWKEESGGQTALLVEGARRIGKSTVVEEFAKNEQRLLIPVVELGESWKKLRRRANL